MNKTRLLCLIATAVLAATSVAAHAQHGGGGMGGGAATGARGDFGGRSDSHISNQGLRNTNGPDAVDRDKGRARAGDRAAMRSGPRHSKAHSHRSKH